ILDHVIVGKNVTVLGNDKPRAERFSALMPVGRRELSLTASLLGSLGRDVDHGRTEFGGQIDKVRQGLGLGHVAAFRGLGPELYFRGGTGRREKNQRSRRGHRRKQSNQLKLHVQKRRPPRPYRADCLASSTYFIRRSKSIASINPSSSGSRLPRVFSRNIPIMSISCCAACKSLPCAPETGSEISPSA